MKDMFKYATWGVFAFVALIVLVPVFSGGAGSRAKTAEDLGRAVFESLKSESFEDFRRLLPHEGNVAFIVEHADKSVVEPESKLREEIQQLDEGAKDAFEKIQEGLERNNIDISKAELKGIAVEDLGEMEGLRSSNIRFVFVAGESRVGVEMRRTAELNDGWYLNGPPDFGNDPPADWLEEM